MPSSPSTMPPLRETLRRYEQPSARRSAFELLVTILPLAAFWGLGLLSVRLGWTAGALLAIPAAAFLVRLFMIQHDCGHGSLFRTKGLNSWIGRAAGVLSMTPYAYWRRSHAIHHATSGNLDRRWLGGVETLTVGEYRALPRLRRIGYRLYRHPVVLFGLGPAYMFVLQHRLPIGLMKEREAWLSVMGTNVGLTLLVLAEAWFAGPKGLLFVHLPVVLLAATVGVWLFYVQHQFEGAYWSRRQGWTAEDAALRGSSHLVLPPPLAWLTANIGAHHVHHAGSRIPFYRLPQVLRDHPELQAIGRISIADTRAAVRLALWDEQAGRLVPF